MASTTTMNTYSDELARSIILTTAAPARVRKHVERFNRMLKSHAYARTNQFEVEYKLDGLEEKFHVLNRQDIADALHKRRSELLTQQQRWTPDILDLLLHLSHQPLNNTRIENLEDRHSLSVVPATLKWADIDDQDSIDHSSRLWRQPNFSDSGSDDEAGSQSSVATSPPPQKSADIPEARASLRSFMMPASEADVSCLVQNSRDPHDPEKLPAKSITEAQLVREVLFFAQGLPSSVFQQVSGRLTVKQPFQRSHLSSASLESALSSIVSTNQAVRTLKQWSNPFPHVGFMQVLTDNLNKVLGEFLGEMTRLESHHLRTISQGGVVSFLRTIDDIRSRSSTILAIEKYINDISDGDAIGHIDLLYEHTCGLEQLGSSEGFKALMETFIPAAASYSTQLDLWMHTGVLPESPSIFFVQRSHDQTDKARLWESWYTLSEKGSDRLPGLLQSLRQTIFQCGKTMAFVNLLGADVPTAQAFLSVSDIIRSSIDSSGTSLTPFAASLSAGLERCVVSQLQQATKILQKTLEMKCDFAQTLNGISNLYLASSPLATDALDLRLFSHLDRCQPTWNDRFLISDLLSEQFADLDTDRIVVHSEPTSPPILPSARRSVDVLANIAFDYLLPWPVANIMLPETLASYRRVSLLLMQIRRAKYALERRAYLRISLLFAKTATTDSLRQIQSLHTTLLIFTTTLYGHLTSCVIAPLTFNLHSILLPTSNSSSAPPTFTVDDLISHHQNYLRNLEVSCLTTKNLKVLKDTLIALLDLCLDFAFMLSDAFPGPASIEEADENMLKGLEQKIERIRAKFGKGVDLLVAGLRGVARSSGSNGDCAKGGRGIRDADGTGPAIDGTKQAGLTLGLGTWDQGDMMELLADSLESALINAGKHGRR